MTLTITVIREYITIANDIMRKCFPSTYKTPIYTDVTISKARSYWAQIKHISGMYYSLKVSNVFNEIEDQEDFENRMISCMVHELIHTLPGCFNHGAKFKAACARVNRMFPGYNLQRATSMEDYGIKREVKPIKYVMSCGKCGATWNYRRRPHIMDMDEMNKHYTCACGAADFHLKEV